MAAVSIPACIDLNVGGKRPARLIWALICDFSKVCGFGCEEHHWHALVYFLDERLYCDYYDGWGVSRIVLLSASGK